MPHANQLLWMGIGQRLQEDTFKHAEDNGVCADADGERDKRDSRE